MCKEHIELLTPYCKLNENNIVLGVIHIFDIMGTITFTVSNLF